MSWATVLSVALALSWFPVHGAWTQLLPPLPGSLVVTLTSPASGSTVAGTITVGASVSPVGALVGSVQFRLDGADLGVADTTAPYAISWNTTSAGDGSHTLTAVARDALGLQFASDPVTVTVSNGPPPDTTRVEESAAALDPAGAWAEITNEGAGAALSGGRAVFTGGAGATAAFTFEGTDVAWIGLPCEICGIAEVFVDGALAGTVDTFAPSRPAASSVLFSVGDLPAGGHTLVVKVTGTRNPSSGGANVVVDAIDVEGGASGGGGDVTRIEETDPAVIYAGSWIQQFDPSVSGGSVVESLDPNGTAGLTFAGTGVSWIGFKADFGGIAEVYLDGALVATVDTYAPTWQPQVVMYTASGLPSGSHTVVIKVTGTWNPSGRSAWIVVDAFDVTGDGGGGGPAQGTTPP